MRWKQDDNKFIWSKETDKVRALYKNFFVRRNPRIEIDVQVKNDSDSFDVGLLGDVEYELEKWSSAFSVYSRSLCFAVGNKQMSITYMKRAKCFYEMRMFKECITDLDFAKQYEYSNDKELEGYRVKCLKYLKLGKQLIEYGPTLDYEQHENFPGVANILKISMNKSDGIHIIAMADIDVGKTIMIEKAFTSIANGVEKRCSNCFSSHRNIIPCKKCTRALFCVGCENCEMHRLECGIEMPKMASLLQEDFMHVVRSIVVAINMFKNVDELKEFVESVINEDQMQLPTESIDIRSKYKIFLRHFKKNYPKDTNDIKAKIQSIYKALMGQKLIAEKFPLKYQQRFLMHLVAHHVSIRRNIANGVEYHFKIVTPVIGSYINHSCSPNTILLSMENCVVATACRPIKAGEEICISYNGSKFQCDYIERQSILDNEFHFKCQCERCNLEVTGKLKYKKSFLSELEEDQLKNILGIIKCDMVTRTNLTALCIRLLTEHGRDVWCRDLGTVITMYIVLLHSKLVMKISY